MGLPVASLDFAGSSDSRSMAAIGERRDPITFSAPRAWWVRLGGLQSFRHHAFVFCLFVLTIDNAAFPHCGLQVGQLLERA